MKKDTIITPKETVQLLLISLFSALFAYTIIYFLTNMTSLYFAYDFDIPAHFNLYNLTFDIDDASKLWTHDATITLFISRPIAALFMGIISLLALMLVRKKLMSFFFFLMWLTLLAFNNAVGVLADDILAKSGTYHIAILMNFDVSILIVISIIAIYLLIRIGMIVSYIFHASFPNMFYKNQKNRYLLLSLAILVPWLFMFLLPFFSTANDYQTITLLKNSSMLFLLLPLFTLKPNKNKFATLEKVSQTQKYDLINVILFAIGTWLLYYFMIDGVFLY